VGETKAKGAQKGRIAVALDNPQAVDRVVRVLLAFSAAGPELGISDLSRQVGLGKSVVHRIVTGLARLGFVSQDPTTSRYRLGPGAIQLGLSALEQYDLASVARPVMENLRAGSQETVTLTIKVGDHRTYLSQLESPRDIRMRVEIGRSFPLYAGASGRAILASLPEAERNRYLDTTPLVSLTAGTIHSREKLERDLETVGSQGYASSAGERDPLAAAVAAPLKDATGALIGAISICGPVPRFTPERVEAYGRLVQDATAELSAQLAHNRQFASSAVSGRPD
jgi:DNA-binding IclR family transcriptional regulator